VSEAWPPAEDAGECGWRTLAAVAGMLTLLVVVSRWQTSTSAYEVSPADDPFDDRVWLERRLLHMHLHIRAAQLPAILCSLLS
jgi:hypothetical protein